MGFTRQKRTHAALIGWFGTPRIARTPFVLQREVFLWTRTGDRRVFADERIVQLMLELLPPNGRVLDVGCGGGHMLRALAERGVEGVGIDPQPYGSSPCRRLRAEEITKLGERFELVYALHALHEFDAPERFPGEAREVLRPRGVLLIVDWVRGAKTGVRERYFAIETVAGWMVDAGFDMLRQEVRRRKMILVGRLAGRAEAVGYAGAAERAGR